MDNVKRYLTPVNDSEVESIKKAFGWAKYLCEQLNEDIVLFVPTKKNIDGTTIEKVIGRNVVKTLLSGEAVTLCNNRYLKLVTEKTFKKKMTSDIIIGIYVTKKMLDMIDDCKNTSAVIIVPWNMEEVKDWIKTWNPKIIGEKEQKNEDKLINNSIVERALEILTNSINISTGLSHPNDKNKAIELLKLLYEEGELFDPNLIKSWALKNGWSSDGANKLKEIAEAILNGKQIRISNGPYWNVNLIQSLRDEVNKDA